MSPFQRAGLIPVLLALAPSFAMAASEIADDRGCLHRNTSSHPSPKVTWTGGCADGHAEGVGQQTFYVNGTVTSTYTGALKGGVYAGAAAWQTPAGHRFEGTYVNGKRQGHGVYMWPDGARYDGDFVEGQMTGEGVFNYPDGGRYEGSFLNGMREGKGTQTDRDGTRYEGEFAKDVAVGPGVLIRPFGEYGIRQEIVSKEQASKLCPKDVAPDMPEVKWRGVANYVATITVKGTSIVDVNLVSASRAPDRNTDALFRESIMKAIDASSVCPGDHIFTRSFVFRSS